MASRTNTWFPARSLLSSPLRITLIYFGAGLFWILIAEALLSAMPPHSRTINRIVFVTVTGLTLYFVSTKYSSRLSALHRSEQANAALARAYVEAAAEGILVIDEDGLIRRANPQVLAMFGYTEEQLLRQPVEVLVPERMRGRHLGHRKKFAEEPRSRRMGAGADVIGRRCDGSEFPAEISLGVARTGEDRRTIVVITDVTARRLTERSARRIETLNSLGAVAAGIAHELNNPLGVILARIDLMLSEPQDLSSATRDDLMVLHRNVERAIRISRNLLALARQRPSVRNPVDINLCAEEIVLLAAGNGDGASPRVEMALDRALPPVTGDQIGLEQVLLNLLMNARDAGADRVRIKTSPDAERPGWLRISVSDNGCGIAPDSVAKVFEPFFTTRAEGTGLGLWLSQRVIADHGGSIEAHSELRNGTTFVIHLPTVAADEHAASLAKG